MDEKYNGWSNFATWKVSLEFFNGNDNKGYDAQAMKDMVHDYLDTLCKDNWCKDLAIAFISDVNWYEIEKAYNEDEEDDD